MYKLSCILALGFASAEGLLGSHAGAGPHSEGHRQRAAQAPLPKQSRPTLLHRSTHAAEPHEMRA